MAGMVEMAAGWQKRRQRAEKGRPNA